MFGQHGGFSEQVEGGRVVEEGEQGGERVGEGSPTSMVGRGGRRNLDPAVMPSPIPHPRAAAGCSDLHPLHSRLISEQPHRGAGTYPRVRG